METTIYFGTNRNLIEENGKVVDFGKGFSPNGLSDLRFGRATVDTDTYDILRLEVLPDIPSEGSKKVFSEVKDKMAKQGRDTLIVIHGYSNSFREAIIFAAKAKIAYKPANLNVFSFSWPSDGKVFPPQAYSDDRHDAMASGFAFARGIMKLVQFFSTGPVCGQRLHLLCHSMGNYLLRNALQSLINNPSGWAASGQLPRIFENIFSMAADEDADALDVPEKWLRLPELTRNLHIYFNNYDHALMASDLTKGNPDRLGSDGPAHPLDLHSKVTLVDVSRLQKGIDPGHRYYIEQPKVVADIVQVFTGAPPDKVRGRVFVTAKNRYVIV